MKEKSGKLIYKPSVKVVLSSEPVVKKSGRKTKRVVQAEKIQKFKQAVREEAETDLEVRLIPEKGRGLFTLKSLSRGDFVVEYAGDLIDTNEAKMREWAYGKKTGSSFMFYFSCFNEMLCVDATEETLRKGRLVNHSRKCNVQAKPFEVDGVPRIILIANRDIPAGSELTMDYGDRSIKSIKAHPWLAN